MIHVMYLYITLRILLLNFTIKKIIQNNSRAREAIQKLHN